MSNVLSMAALNYGRLLFENSPEYDETIKELKALESDELREALANPEVTSAEKRSVINRIFKRSASVIEQICKNQDYGVLEQLAESYREFWNSKNSVIEARLEFAKELEDGDVDKIKDFIIKKYNARDAKIELVENKALISGYRLTVGSQVYDNSAQTALDKLRGKLASGERSITSSDDVAKILKEEIEDFRNKMTIEDAGTIISMGDGIVTVHGLEGAMYGEMVKFDTGVAGMVQGLGERTVSIVLLGSDHGLHEGSKVSCTGKRAGVPVGDGLIGRVVNAVGEPIDGLGAIKQDDFYPIERPAPGVVERQPVNVPLETGILTIDSMFPIGRGQRELIIGDRQTGKTSIAIDTIVNQKGKDVICVYVAIGQKASTVAKLVNDLKATDAMQYTIVLSSPASDPASLQYVAPYAGTAMAEYFMYKGKDVLIVYDDLSKHAVAYRAMSLLLERPPGREAYPGDVFYLHSRLLERSSRLDEAHGGGSITALPIIETQAGDVSAYIPTNVISITDGQIFLESELFFSGNRPAVNVGLSVSRVGGAAQTKAMKKAAGHMRIDLAQYREMEVFTQFSSDLDPATKELLDSGDRIMEMLKQPLLHPLSLSSQVILLTLSGKKQLLDVPLEDISKFKSDFIDYVEAVAPGIIKSIEETHDLNVENESRICGLCAEFKSERYAERQDRQGDTETDGE